MTLAEAKKLVSSLGGKLTFNRDYDEYTVKFGRETYFTNDRQDAIGTAKLIAEKRAKKKNPSSLKVKSGEWIPCHAIRVRAGKLEIMKDALANPSRRKTTTQKLATEYKRYGTPYTCPSCRGAGVGIGQRGQEIKCPNCKGNGVIRKKVK